MNEPLPGPYEAAVDVPSRGLSIYSDDGWRIATVAEEEGGDRGPTVATARLLAASWELREALTTIEWERHGVVHGEVQPICAACDASQVEGHAAECIVDVALRKAGGHGAGAR